MVLPTFSNQRSSFMIPGVFFHGVQTSKHFPVEMIATKLTQGYQHTLRRHTVHTLCTFGVRFVQKNVYLLHPKSLLLKRAQGGKTCNFGSFDCHPRPIVIKVEASGLSLANESGRLLFLPFCFCTYMAKYIIVIQRGDEQLWVVNLPSVQRWANSNVHYSRRHSNKHTGRIVTTIYGFGWFTLR